MFYLDNSETSWLVYADWLEDQDINANHIRQEVVEPTSNDWCHEYKTAAVGVAGAGAVGGVGGLVGGVGVGYGVGGYGVGLVGGELVGVGGGLVGGVGG